MKTIEQLKADLSAKTLEHMGFDLNDYDQGSDEWKAARLGVITASRVHDIIKPGRKKGTFSEARKTYMYELIAEVLTRKSKSASSIPMEWGKEHEGQALDEFLDYEPKIHKLPFIFSDDMRYGYSPDALYDDLEDFCVPVEVKCPYATENHLKTVFDKFIKPEYMSQMAFGAWMLDKDYCTFVSYDPRIIGDKLFIMDYEVPEETLLTFEKEIPLFIEEMDELLNKTKAWFGCQWEADI